MSLLATACAAGQHAATSEEVPAIDGTHGILGPMYLENVAIHAPAGKAASYPAGANVVLQAVIVNNGHHPDTLTSVTTSAFASWNIVSKKSSGDAGGPADTAQIIQPGSAVSLGLTNVGDSGTGTSPSSIMLVKLAKTAAPLFPAAQLKITFTFAHAGSKTLTVPVQLSVNPPHQTVAPLPTNSD
jgi:hypothetical protein